MRVATGVGWARLKYRLTFVYAWPKRVELACAALKKAVLGRVGMHPGAAKAAVETMVWMSGAQEISVERILMLLKLLSGGGVVGAGVEGSIQQ